MPNTLNRNYRLPQDSDVDWRDSVGDLARDVDADVAAHATTAALNAEISARGNADAQLQNNIDARNDSNIFALDVASANAPSLLRNVLSNIWTAIVGKAPRLFGGYSSAEQTEARANLGIVASSDGALTKIASLTLTSTLSGNLIDVQNIPVPAGAKHLKIIARLNRINTGGTGGTNVTLTLNSDTSFSYKSNTNPAVSTMNILPSTGGVNTLIFLEITIPCYADSDFAKEIFSSAGDTAGNNRAQNFYYIPAVNAPITSIQISNTWTCDWGVGTTLDFYASS